jgi:hypothetical protein
MGMNHIKRRHAFGAAIVIVIVFLSIFLYLEKGRAPQKIDVLTYHYNNQRTGNDDRETILTPKNVNVATFGKLFAMPVDADVYAQPLYKTNLAMPVNPADPTGSTTLRDVLYVATSNDSLYAFDADTGQQLWQDSFIDPSRGITPVPAVDVHSTDIQPEIGIVGTPVIDAQTNTLYVVSKDKAVVAGAAAYQIYLHAIDIVTGKEKFNGPARVSASAETLKGEYAFDSFLQDQRSSLTLLSGHVYITWASHGGNGPYHGWVMGYNAYDISKQTSVFLTTPDGLAGGVWISGGGPSTEGSSTIYLGVANGTFDVDQGGHDYADTEIKFAVGSTTPDGRAPLSVADYFTPIDQKYLQDTDSDFGVSSPVILPEKTGPHPHELVASDKKGELFIIDRDDLGKIGTSSDTSVENIQVPSSLHNNYSYFNGMLYIGADNDLLRAYRISDGLVSTSSVSQTSEHFGNGKQLGSGVNPVVSSNGNKDGIVWIVDNSNFDSTTTPAVLHAYDASDLSDELYNTVQAHGERDALAPAVKFVGAMVANGKVYVSGKSQVTVYGLLSQPK